MQDTIIIIMDGAGMDINNGMAIEVDVVDVCPDVEMELDVDRWKGNNFE